MKIGSLVALGAALTLIASVSADAFVLYTTSRGIALHWGPGPVEFFIASDLPDDLDRDRVAAAATASWDAWTTLDCARFEGGFGGFAPDLVASMGDGLNSVVWVHDEAEWRANFSDTELARTVVTHRSLSGEIVDADVLVNAGGFTFSDSADCAPNAYDLRSLLTHELGHFFGLDHSHLPSATMDPNTDPGVCDKRSLDPDDVAGFCAIYEALRPPPADPGPEALADVAPREDDLVSDTSELDPGAGRRPVGCAGGAAGDTMAWSLLALLSLYALGARRRRRRSRAPCRPR